MPLCACVVIVTAVTIIVEICDYSLITDRYVSHTQSQQ